uniref:NADH dehydrogenase subunit 6 n=1 Tax=Carsidara limbata TaxID=2591562 RepID=UPI003002E781|nr:NADH dehydrogenase subunit 6 [Carsidara limbata]
MLKLILLNLMLMSSLMSNCSHPFMFSFFVLIQTIMISIMSQILMMSSWMSLTLFMIMVGGLMIIFMYTTSICSNQRFMMPKILNSILYLIVYLPIFMINENFMMKIDNLYLNNFNFKEFWKLFMPMSMISSMFMFLYLILALMVMMNIMNYNSGPMRKKY